MGEFLKGLASLAWPLIVFFVLVRFGKEIGRFIESWKSRKMKIKIGDYEITMEEVSKQQQTFISDLQEQIIVLQNKFNAIGPEVKKATRVRKGAGRKPVRSVLWVDDEPENNAFLIEQISRTGITVAAANSTDEGLEQMDRQEFDGIITSMGRKEHGDYKNTAGIDFVKRVRINDKQVHIIIYTTLKNVRSFKSEALKAGANEIVSSAVVLLQSLEVPVNE